MEVRIYKPKRVCDGKRTIGRLYRARIKLSGDNKVRDIALEVPDKQVAQQKLNKLIQELEHESAGLIPAKTERPCWGVPWNTCTMWINDCGN